MTHFFTIEKPAVAEFRDRGSKFLACAYPVNSTDEFKNILRQLKKEHPKAVHHCFAYRIGVSGDIYRVSDDGEPSGTAGRQILGQIDSKHLTNTAVVVVRYFGGTLLGVPGLINAYKTATSIVLQIIPAVQKEVEANYMIHFAHSDINEVMLLIKHFNCTVMEQDQQLFPFVKIKIPVHRLHEMLSRLKDLRNVEFRELV